MDDKGYEENRIGSLVASQKSMIVDLINLGQPDRAVAALIVVADSWRVNGYSHKLREVATRIQDEFTGQTSAFSARLLLSCLRYTEATDTQASQGEWE